MKTTDHAARQARLRGIDPAEVGAIVDERIGQPRCDCDLSIGGIHRSWCATTTDVAVFVGWAEGWAGGSNGDEVWAIVRAGAVSTVMFRRADQPATPVALRVERVVR
jgi:hypothetical protein